MKATEILMEEHRVIERVLTALERAATRLSNGQEVYLRFFTGTTVFIKNFADGFHHQKEEGILFPAMIENAHLRVGGRFAEGDGGVQARAASHALILHWKNGEYPDETFWAS